ncbi:hypothetical protein FOPG_16002 [Fusarium oxysporum f. sp. conglutinans race 2 54008]|uniref:NACHT-NTPase sigma domain-containing protein n=3 Tax=Fusarium oxysporum f. sp. conglutinans TaxID=100902 RepID=A0A8H6LGB2_FUSOX|nr:hypothetical protein FOXB_06702 [Fusarium oxysporum f. sp. conglutinans Fo5176]EXL67904.1 hypothetical protein FOPG_16002 [Fusarium oxysporum f. sp. conglutinans race 2 54008]KAF6519527.1 hypothetical protein HZS61_017901 [Fusarium oxysporum f. sp. conglutinans]KAG6986140.1 hypothetical protein FocnCong_v003712 [Fusarium oxysporum f. sp. conglutinans]
MANGLANHATNLLNDLTTDRACSNASSRPLAFVAHSLGGLVYKEAILLPKQPRTTSPGHIRLHQGHRIPGHASQGILDGRLGQDTGFGPWGRQNHQQVVVEHLGDRRHVPPVRSRSVLVYVGKVVSRDSVTLEGYNAISIHANHSKMVKFSSVDDNGFKSLLGELIRWESQIRDSAARQPKRPIAEAPITKSANSSFNNYGPGDQLNAPWGTQNISKGSGNQFSEATFSGSVQFGKEGS